MAGTFALITMICLIPENRANFYAVSFMKVLCVYDEGGGGGERQIFITIKSFNLLAFFILRFYHRKI